MLAIAALFTYLASPAAALDALETADGDRVRGNVAETSRAGVTFEVAGRRRFVPAIAIADAVWEGSPAKLRLVTAAEEDDPAGALADYARLAADASGRVAEEIAFRRARLTARIAVGEVAGEAADGPAASSTLSAFLLARPDSPRATAAARWLGRVGLMTADRAAVTQAATFLSDGPTPFDRALGRALKLVGSATSNSEAAAILDECERDLAEPIESPEGDERFAPPAAVVHVGRLIIATAAAAVAPADAARRFDRFLADLGPSDLGPDDPLRAAALSRRAELFAADGNRDAARLDHERLVWLFPHLPVAAVAEGKLADLAESSAE